MDKRGNVARAKMARGGRKKGKAKQQVVAKVGVKKKSGYLYFIDKRGDISCAKMVRGGRKRKAKKRVKRKATKKTTKKKTTKSRRRR